MVSPVARRCLAFVAAATGLLALVVYVAGSPAVATSDPTGQLTQKAGAEGCLTSGSDASCTPAVGLEHAGDIVVSPDGSSAYAVTDGAGGGAATVFRRSPQGVLTQLDGQDGCISVDGSGGDCSDGAGVGSPTGVVVSPDGANVYFISPGHDAIASFERHEDGRLVQLPAPHSCVSANGLAGECTDGRGLAGAVRAAISPDGRTVYVAATGASSPTFVPSTLTVFTRDLGTGVLTQLDGAAGCLASDDVDGCTVVRGLSGVERRGRVARRTLGLRSGELRRRRRPFRCRPRRREPHATRRSFWMLLDQ